MSTGGADFTGTERFVIVRRIGAGGMGVVYEAHDRERDARVALKTLHRLDAEALYRLKQEFRALTDISHPNLIQLYELFSVRGQWFFTMELVRGVSFLEHVRTDPRLSAAETPVAALTEPAPDSTTLLLAEQPTPLLGDGDPGGAGHAAQPLTAPEEFDRLRTALAQLAEGVCALHAAGKLHRDIKPSNVLVTPTGRVVLLDFGLVAELRSQLLDPGGPAEIAGTVAYMAPEQAAGRPLSPASDWYSVGVVLFKALTGRRLFGGDSAHLLLWNKQHTEAPPVDRWAPNVPQDLKSLCADLLRRRPEDRPLGAEVLCRLCGARVPPAPPPSAPGRSPGAGSPFVGRESHLAALHDAYRAARQGGTVVVFIHGRSGAGKSLLVQRFLEDLVGGQEVVVLAGRCYERESVPYKALDSVVDDLSRYLWRLPREEAEALLPRDTPALARLFPVLRRAEAVAAVLTEGPDIPDPHEVRRRAFGALRELLGRLAGGRPLVLAIDDLQWGDSDSAALLVDILRPP
jgi:serine/threonine protein kinase